MAILSSNSSVNEITGLIHTNIFEDMRDEVAKNNDRRRLLGEKAAAWRERVKETFFGYPLGIGREPTTLTRENVKAFYPYKSLITSGESAKVESSLKSLILPEKTGNFLNAKALLKYRFTRI